MPTTSPWHSARKGENRHHNNTVCPEGNNIETYNRKPGTGGYPLCSDCSKLNSQGK